MDDRQREAELAAARAYNIRLQSAVMDSDDGAGEGYDSILDFGHGIMGYISIPMIDVKLPVYHGVSTEVLEKGVGHLPSSSFPIAGEGNHAVLTGHTGLPSASLFTDLDQMKEEDRFEVTIGGETMTYQVDQIKVVLPSETEDLMPVPGEDYCTLVTCTPYGVNSHRLLVRGSRVETEEVQPVIRTGTPEEADVKWNWLWIFAIVPVCGCVFLLKRKREWKDD